VHSTITWLPSGLTGKYWLVSYHCCHFQQLSIAINASVIDHTLNTPPNAACNTRISELNLHASFIQNAHAVAAFLLDVLPNVRKIDSWNNQAAINAAVSSGNALKYKSQWAEVASLVEIFAKVRKQERSHMMEHAGVGGLTCQCQFLHNKP
jgi:hypothetical protein